MKNDTFSAGCLGDIGKITLNVGSDESERRNELTSSASESEAVGTGQSGTNTNQNSTQRDDESQVPATQQQMPESQHAEEDGSACNDSQLSQEIPATQENVKVLHVKHTQHIFIFRLSAFCDSCNICRLQRSRWPSPMQPCFQSSKDGLEAQVTATHMR
jgi:hypothetical protein